MPGRPSAKELQKQLLECRQIIAALSTDPTWGITTRAAIPYAPLDGAAYVVYATLAPIEPTFLPLNGNVRRALHTRSAPCILRARWDGPNDAVFVLSAHPLQFCKQLEIACRNEELSASVGWSTYTGNLPADVEECKKNMGMAYTIPAKGE